MFRQYKGVLPRVPPSAYIDVSAQVIGDVEIGESSSVWTPRSLVMGRPGKVRRELTDEDVASVLDLANRYVDYRLEYQGAASNRTPGRG